MCPDFLDEPGPQGRDSSQGMLIAPGIVLRLVPGSPAIAYLGCGGPRLKLVGTFLEHFGKTLERGSGVVGSETGGDRRGRSGSCRLEFGLQTVDGALQPCGFRLVTGHRLVEGRALGAHAFQLGIRGLLRSLQPGEFAFELGDFVLERGGPVRGAVGFAPCGLDLVLRIRHAVAAFVQLVGEQQRGEQQVCASAVTALPIPASFSATVAPRRCTRSSSPGAHATR